MVVYASCYVVVMMMEEFLPSIFKSLYVSLILCSLNLYVLPMMLVLSNSLEGKEFMEF